MTTRLTQALAVAASAGLIAVGLPAAAAHATELPVIHNAHSDFDGDLGTLLVDVSAPLGVTTVEARLTTFATGEEVASTDDFVLRSGTTTAGVWATAQPFLLDELGNYRVHIAVTDTGGNLVERDNAGVLNYSVATAIQEVELNRTTVTYEERDVAITGVLTGRWPGTGEIRSLAGFPVSVNSFFGREVVTTGEDGTFTGTVTISFEGEFVWAQFTNDNNHPFFNPSTTDDFLIAIQPRQTRITIKARPARIDRGELTTLRGRLEWKTPLGWEPVPDAQLGILFCDLSCPTVVDRPLTDEHGQYEVVAEPIQTGHYQVAYQAQDPVFFQPDPFVAPAQATADIVVLQPASFSDFHAARNEQGMVALGGHLQFENFTPGEIPVKIQFSPNGIAAWRTVTAVDAEWDGEGNMFAAELEWPASGYWRARYPGQRDFFQRAVTPTVFVP